MPAHRRIVTMAAAAIALMGLLPGSALAAGPTVSGTVTRDGAPVAGAGVNVLVLGTDMVWHGTTDANGAFSIAADVAVGQKVQVTATSPAVQSSPDKDGCVTFEAASGSAEVTVDAVPIEPLAIALDHPVNSTVCSATATPRALPTPPATDAGTPGAADGPGVPTLALVLGALALLAVGALARRPARHA